MIKHYKSLALFIVYLLAPFLAVAEQDANNVKAKVLETISQIKPITVHGVVLDQHGRPVPGARVRVSWTEVRIPPDPGQSKWIEANDLGEWSILINKPHRIFVLDVERKGYQFDKKASAYFKAPNREELIKQTSEDNPLMLTMRKKGQSVFLVHHAGRIDFLQPGGAKRIDLFEKKIYAAETPAGHSDSPPWDLEIEAAFSGEGQVWNFIFAADSENGGGVFANDAVLYEVPAQGYSTQALTSVSLKEHRRPLSVYVMSRDPSVYARMDVEFLPRKEMCIVSYRIWANPYGTRNLEYDQAFDKEWKLRKRLEREVRSELSLGNRPKQMDFEVLIEAELEKDR